MSGPDKQARGCAEHGQRKARTRRHRQSAKVVEGAVRRTSRTYRTRRVVGAHISPPHRSAALRPYPTIDHIECRANGDAKRHWDAARGLVRPCRVNPASHGQSSSPPKRGNGGDSAEPQRAPCSRQTHARTVHPPHGRRRRRRGETNVTTLAQVLDRARGYRSTGRVAPRSVRRLRGYTPLTLRRRKTPLVQDRSPRLKGWPQVASRP